MQIMNNNAFSLITITSNTSKYKNMLTKVKMQHKRMMPIFFHLITIMLGSRKYSDKNFLSLAIL